MSEVVREKPRYGLVLARSDDGTYRLLVDGVETFNSRVASAVEIEYDEVLAERSAEARSTRLREQGHFQMQGLLAQTAQSKAASRNAGRSRGKGG